MGCSHFHSGSISTSIDETKTWWCRKTKQTNNRTMFSKLAWKLLSPCFSLRLFWCVYKHTLCLQTLLHAGIPSIHFLSLRHQQQIYQIYIYIYIYTYAVHMHIHVDPNYRRRSRNKQIQKQQKNRVIKNCTRIYVQYDVKRDIFIYVQYIHTRNNSWRVWRSPLMGISIYEPTRREPWDPLDSSGNRGFSRSRDLSL